MIKHYLLFVMLFFSMEVIAQTGIGTATPDISAKLDVSATNKGFLPPRVSLSSITDQSTIPSPATGLLVYCKGDAGLAAGYYFWNGNAWATIATAGGSGSVASSFLRGSKTASQSLNINDVITFSQIDNTAGQDISLNTSNGKITLAAGNTYRIRGAVPNFIGLRPAFMWYNETTSSYIGSATNAYNPGDNAGNGATGGTSEAIITPNVNTVISFRLLSSLNSGSITASGNVDFSTSGSYPWFDIQVISGNAPVTGQSVDYVSVRRAGSDQTVNTGDIIVFNSIDGGNIPYNTSTGLFSLSAGKTYKLLASVSLSNGNGAAKEVNINWKNAAGDILGSKGEMLSPSANVTAAGGGMAYAIYTPITNTTVALYVNYSSASTMLWQNFSFASIEQIGSSAIVNPWTLSGTNTYNTTGNVGIGTTNPTSYASNTLQVNGANSASIKITNSAIGVGNTDGLDLYQTASDTYLWNRSNGFMSFGTNNGERMRITNGGYVGIGTATPAFPLDIRGSASSTITNYYYLNRTSTGSASSYTLSFSVNASDCIKAAEFDAVSDKRIKTNIHPFLLSNSISLVNKLRPVTYEYIDKVSKGSKTKNGFIAQDVESVLPNAVNKSSDFIPNIFKLVNNADGFDAICKECKIGDELKIITSKGDKIVKITGIKNVNKEELSHIKIDWNEPESKYFVYGIKVNDFRTIDFDQITSLSISAIQELLKKNEDQEARLQKVEKFISELQKTNKH